jgi:predicted dehydrogenase
MVQTTTFPPLTPLNGKLRVGLVGAGDISFYHLSAWRKLATVELAAICDLDDARARRHAEEHRFDNKLGYQARFDEAIAHFVSALIAGTAFETEGEDNLQTLRLVEDSYGLAAPNRAH